MKGFFCDFEPYRLKAVMPGLGPGVHILAAATKDMNGRVSLAKTGFAL
jgi:hypothetical protein